MADGSKYLVSYFLIVIMWINHHFLWSFANAAMPRYIFWNFGHMFAASLEYASGPIPLANC